MKQRLLRLKKALRGIFPWKNFEVAFLNRDYYVVVFDNVDRNLNVFRLKSIDKAREELWKIKKSFSKSPSLKFAENEDYDKDKIKFYVKKLFGTGKIYIT